VKFLVVGHEGYIGSALCRTLESEGHSVKGWGRNQDLFKLSRSDLDINKIDTVVNCATATYRKEADYEIDGPEEKINVFGVRHLVSILKGTTIGLVHLSTKEVYGNVYNLSDLVEKPYRLMPKFEIDDSQALMPLTCYAKTKLMGEFIANSYPRANVIRISSCYTDFDHKRGNWVVNLFKTVSQGTPPVLTGTGKQVRDPLHVEDLTHLIASMAEGRSWGLTMNAGGGLANSISILEYVQLIAPTTQPKFIPNGDLGFIANNRLARDMFKWTPQIMFRERISQVFENLKAQRSAELK
jgi:nucleoside-diphosphate-sugar epimerase